MRLRGDDGVEVETRARSFQFSGLSSAPVCRRICSPRPSATPPRPRSSRSAVSTCGCGRMRPAGYGGSSTRCPTQVSVPRRPPDPRVDGTSDLGPNAVLALAREGYRRTDVSWRGIAAGPLGVLPAASTAALDDRGARVPRVAGAARYLAEARTTALAGDRRRNERPRRCARPGGRSRRLSRGRLPHQPGRTGHLGPQRAVTGGDGFDGDRRAHRRRTQARPARHGKAVTSVISLLP